MDTAALDSHRVANRLQSLLRSHPPTAERVRRLLELLPRDGLTLDPLHPGGNWRPLAREPRAPRWRLSGLWH